MEHIYSIAAIHQKTQFSEFGALQIMCVNLALAYI